MSGSITSEQLQSKNGMLRWKLGTLLIRSSRNPVLPPCDQRGPAARSCLLGPRRAARTRFFGLLLAETRSSRTSSRLLAYLLCMNGDALLFPSITGSTRNLPPENWANTYYKPHLNSAKCFKKQPAPRRPGLGQRTRQRDQITFLLILSSLSS